MRGGFLGLDVNCFVGGVPVELFKLLRGVNKFYLIISRVMNLYI